MKKSLIALACAATFSVYADVDYRISITQPQHHLAEVEVQFPKSSQSSIDVQLPDWRTGRYEILDLANGVRFFDAKSQSGQSQKWEKIDKNTWRVHLSELPS